MSLDDSRILYFYNFKTTKEMWDTLEIIYEVSPSIEREEMNTRGKEGECFIHKCFSKFINVWNYIETFVTNRYLRVKNWKSGLILKSRDESVHWF